MGYTIKRQYGDVPFVGLCLITVRIMIVGMVW